MTSTPPAKRARRSNRTFEMSPAVAQAAPVYTKLSNVKPGHLYNRVTFVSMGSTTQKGEWMILLELIDDTSRAPMKMTVLGAMACTAVGDVDFSSVVQLRNVRCT
eukprot:3951725-Amphidinium_carterae.1